MTMSVKLPEYEGLTPLTLAAADAYASGYSDYYTFAAVAAGLALLGWLGYSAWRNKDDFRITVRNGEVYFRGRFPRHQQAAIASFLLDDVAPASTIRVLGNWGPYRVLRIAVRGRISVGDAQRIRNFLKMNVR
jgi:hypothetical protein